MSKQIDPDAIPGMGSVEIKKEKVLLRNVLFGKDGQEDIEVEVVPFDRYDDKHVDFAYEYSDMLFRSPSLFKNVNDAARAYVSTFMVHAKEDEKNANSNYCKILGDLRACRTLFHQNTFMRDINDFFENA